MAVLLVITALVLAVGLALNSMNLVGLSGLLLFCTAMIYYIKSDRTKRKIK